MPVFNFGGRFPERQVWGAGPVSMLKTIDNIESQY